MTWCLTPAPWSPVADRRAAPFRAREPEAQRAELRERSETFDAWRRDFGGRSFVEEADSGCVYIIRALDDHDDGGAVVLHDRVEAFALLARMREGGINASLSVRKRRPR